MYSYPDDARVLCVSPRPKSFYLGVLLYASRHIIRKGRLFICPFFFSAPFLWTAGRFIRFSSDFQNGPRVPFSAIFHVFLSFFLSRSCGGVHTTDTRVLSYYYLGTYADANADSDKTASSRCCHVSTVTSYYCASFVRRRNNACVLHENIDTHDERVRRARRCALTREDRQTPPPQNRRLISSLLRAPVRFLFVKTYKSNCRVFRIRPYARTARTLYH